MLTSALAAGLALLSMQQVRDASTIARDAYTSCLNTYMSAQIRARTEMEAFRTALPQQCQAEEQRFRDSIRTREAQYRTPAAEVTQLQNEEVNDARTNVLEMFEASIAPRS